MLPAAKHVKEVYLGENGVLEVLKAGSLCIDSSTIDPQTIKDIAAVAQSKILKFVMHQFLVEPLVLKQEP